MWPKWQLVQIDNGMLVIRTSRLACHCEVVMMMMLLLQRLLEWILVAVFWANKVMEISERIDFLVP